MQLKYKKKIANRKHVREIMHLRIYSKICAVNSLLLIVLTLIPSMSFLKSSNNCLNNIHFSFFVVSTCNKNLFLKICLSKCAVPLSYSVDIFFNSLSNVFPCSKSSEAGKKASRVTKY